VQGDNLLATLLGFASAARPATEDPITEMLAWLIRRDVELRASFLALLGPHFATAAPEVATQVILPRVNGPGLCRPDLVLVDHQTGWRALIEVKVDSGLTASSVDGSMHQVDDYVAIAVRFPRSRGQVDYAANAATSDFNSNSTGLT